MGKLIFLFALILTLFFSFYFISAFWFFDGFKKNIISGNAANEEAVSDNTLFQNSAACQDTDEGIYSSLSGNVIFKSYERSWLRIRNKNRMITDSCNSEGEENIQSSVTEYYCTENGPKSIQITCEYGCKNGRCLLSLGNYCEDIDYGLAPTRRSGVYADRESFFGSTKLTGKGYYEDICHNQSMLSEYICEDNRATIVRVACSEECINGKCINDPSSRNLENLCSNRIQELKENREWLLLGPPNGRVNTFEYDIENEIYYISTSYGGTYESKDKGNTWEYANSKTSQQETPWEVSGHGVVYRKTTSRYSDPQLEFSFDGGITFEPFFQKEKPAESFSSFWDIRGIYPLEGGRAILTNDNGIHEINIHTGIARQLGNVSYNSEITSFAILAPDMIHAIYWDHSSGAVSKDCGLTWSFGERQDIDIIPASETNQFISDSEGRILLHFGRVGLPGSLRLYDGTDQVTAFSEITSLDPGYGATFYQPSQDKVNVYVLNQRLTNQYSNTLKSISGKDADNYKTDIRRGETELIISEIDLKKYHKGLPESEWKKTAIKSLPFRHVKSISVDKSNPSNIYLGGYLGLYKSTDKGETWKALYVESRSDLDLQLDTLLFSDLREPHLSLSILAINPYNSQEIIYQGLDKAFMIKNDVVTEMNLPVTQGVKSIKYDPFISDLLYLGTSNGFYFSTDRGLNWKQFNRGLYSNRITQIQPLQDKVIIGTQGSGIAVILKETLLHG